MIDWAFIESLEGYRLDGYVPDPRSSKSGVTVGSGIDLGQMSREVFLRLPQDLQILVRPYIGLSGAHAVAALAAAPLAVTPEQASELDSVGRADAVTRLRGDYDHFARTGAFDALPDRAQTVIASVSFQYGSLPSRCPRFWSACVRQDWVAAVAELRNFGDAYPTRRNKEVDYLAALIAPHQTSSSQ